MQVELLIIISIMILVLSIIYIIINVRHTRFMKDLLVNHLMDIIEPNSFYERELEQCYTNLVIRIFNAKKRKIYKKNGEITDKFIEYRNEMRRKIKPYIVDIKLGDRYVYPKSCFHQDFCDWIKSHYSAALVSDFYDIVIIYVSYKMQQLNMQVTNENINEYLDVQSSALSNDVKEIMFETNIEKCLSNNVKTIYSNDEQLKSDKKAYIAAYNACIKQIKLSQGIGLVPVCTEHISKSFYDYLCSLKVISQQKLLRENENNNVTSEEGCYIIYNTYTKKYFVGKAKSPLSRVYLVLNRKVLTNSVLLSYEFSLGQMMLIKIVPLNGSGYHTLTDLQKALVRAYNTLNPNGYNRQSK